MLPISSSRTLYCLVFISALFLNACATMGPSTEQLAQADFGEPILQYMAEEMVTEFFATRVDDPDSTTLRFTDLKKDWMMDADLNGGKPMYGYSLEVQMNTRNTLGRFTGDVGYKFMFRDQQIYHIVAQPRLSNDVTYMGKIY